MKEITFADNRTNEILHVGYDIVSQTFFINGVKVSRQKPLESEEEEYVFMPTEEDIQKLYHVLAKDIKSLWS
jgi:hypothetical protein